MLASPRLCLRDVYGMFSSRIMSGSLKRRNKYETFVMANMMEEDRK